MSDPVYIVIPRWDGPDGFQHYRDRDPIWIKNYTRLLSDDGYMKLSLHQRGVLHGIWLEYASSNRQLPGDTLTLTRRLGHRVTSRDIEALIAGEFILLAAAAPPRQSSGSAATDTRQTSDSTIGDAATDKRQTADTPATATDEPRNQEGSNGDPASSTLAPCYPSRAPARSPEPEPDTEREKDQNQNAGSQEVTRSNRAGLDVQTELELAELLAWIGDDADTRTAAVLRHNWTNAPEAARIAVNQSRKTSRPRHRAKWLVATIKAETDRARGVAA